MADWYAYYETATGKLVSIGTVRPGRVRSGITESLIGPNRPPKGWQWNTTTRQYEDRTAAYLAEQEAQRTEESTLRSLEQQVKDERARLEATR